MEDDGIIHLPDGRRKNRGHRPPKDPATFVPKNRAPRPGEPMPVWSFTLTADEMIELRMMRGKAGLGDLRRFIMDAAREKARRDQLKTTDLSTLSRQEQANLTLAIIGQQMETAANTVMIPGFKHDVKGDLVIDPDGTPEMDIDQRTKAQAELRQWLKSLRELRGLDAPSRKRVKHTIIAQDIRKAALELGFDPGDDDGDPDMLAIEGAD